MTKRVLLHVGTPKTGTSYLQDVLFRNRDHLATHGILYPADRFDAHFLAALDLMRLPWGGLESEAVGAWDALAERVRGCDGTAIISHEILATASRTQVGRALESLGHRDGTEIHVVLSVRDLVRQIPAEWQENVKHRADAQLRAASSSRSATREREGRHRHLVLGRPGDPRHPRPLGPRPAARARAPGHRAAAGRRRRRCCGSGSPRPSGSTGIDARPRGRAGEPVAGRARDRAGPPDQPRRQQGRSSRADYRPLVRELLAHQTLSRRTGSPAPRAAAGRAPLGAASSSRRLGRGDRASAGTTWSATSTTCCGAAAAPRRTPTRTSPGEAQVAGAAMDAIKALLLEDARLRETEARPARASSHEAHAGAGAGLPAAVVPAAREKLVRRLRTAGRAAGR